VKREQLNTGLLQEVRRLDRQIFIDLESHETALCGGKHHNTLFCQVSRICDGSSKSLPGKRGATLHDFFLGKSGSQKYSPFVPGTHQPHIDSTGAYPVCPK